MHDEPRRDRDREWEHWPGRGAPDERIRHRLRGLFTPTDATDAVEELIVERGRELERRTEQLASTIADLERREEMARDLRGAVEEMLRHGSAELDARHAELTALAEELQRRSDSIAETERELETRRQELGAVELRRAALERRETTLDRRAAELERIGAELGAQRDALEASATRTTELESLRQELEARAAQLERGLSELTDARRGLAAAQASLAVREHRITELEEVAREATRLRVAEPRGSEPEAEREHLIFVAADRYRLEERPGPAPEPGSPVEIDGSPYTVARIVASPLPNDARRCAFVVHAPHDA